VESTHPRSGEGLGLIANWIPAFAGNDFRVRGNDIRTVGTDLCVCPRLDSRLVSGHGVTFLRGKDAGPARGRRQPATAQRQKKR